MSLNRRVSLFVAPLLAVLVAACSTPVKLDETPVETRTPTPVAGGGTGSAGTATTPAQPSGTAQSQVATVNTGTASASANAALGVRTVYFDFDSFAMRDDAKPVIEAHAKALSTNRTRRMTVEGHTDERGGREYNLALGQKRAEAVVRSLTLLGATDSQLEAVSFGKERPSVTGSDESAWARNRRAELKDKP